MSRVMKKQSEAIDINRVAKMWAANVTAKDIASSVGVGTRTINSLIEKNRERFPYRLSLYRDKVRKQAPEPVPAPAPIIRILPPDRVIRTTISGAKVTMPRVTFIDGPASESMESTR